MAISEDVSSELSDRIAALSIGSTQEISAEDLNDTKLSVAFLANCQALLQELQRCDIRVKVPKKCSTIEHIYIAFQDRLPYFPSTTEHVKYKLLVFLVAELQVERLTAQAESTAMDTESTEATETGMDVDEDTAGIRSERSVLAFQLDKVCKMLQLRVEENSNLDGVLGAVHTHVGSALRTDPALMSDQPPKILRSVGQLSAQQQAKVVAVEDMINKDFALRREMLLKRMEVTVESFLWSEKASCREHEAEIRAAVRSQQHHLAAPPRRYQLCDALKANVALLHEQSKKITGDSQVATSSSSATKSIIKQILVGEVPDRGGRANEVRPKQLRAEVRRAFGGSGSGSGGKKSGGDGQSGETSKSGDKSAKEGTEGGAGNMTQLSKADSGNKSQKDTQKGGKKGFDTPGATTAASTTSNGGSQGNNSGGGKNKKAAEGSGRQVSVQPPPPPPSAQVQDSQPKSKNKNTGGGGNGSNSGGSQPKKVK